MSENKKLLKLTIARVDGPVFDGEVVSVAVPSVSGNLELLADHEALITPLKKGMIRIKKGDGEVETFELERGTLEVSHNHTTILI
jgi:F-type H+-transporting ATPase subunit epsilon